MKTKNSILLYLLFWMGVCLMTTNAQTTSRSATGPVGLIPSQVEFLDSLYLFTGGTNWRYGTGGTHYTINELTTRGDASTLERPYIRIGGGRGSPRTGRHSLVSWQATGERGTNNVILYHNYDIIVSMDLSNMNLVGDLPNNMTLAQLNGTFLKDWNTRTDGERPSHTSITMHFTEASNFTNLLKNYIRLSYNQLTGLPSFPFYIEPDGFNSFTSVTELRVDHNKIREINWTGRDYRSVIKKSYNFQNSTNDGMYILDLQQNDITHLSMSRLGFISSWKTSGADGVPLIIANRAERVRVDNNRLPMRQLISLKRDLKELVRSSFRGNFRYDGNANLVFEYLPQKPIGGDPTEITLAGGVEHTVSYVDPYTAGDNVYSWQLNGRDIPLSNTKDFIFTVSETGVGVYRCKITNPRLPDAELYTFDQSVFLVSTTNQAPTDFTFSATSIIPDFPEGFIVGSFSGTDPDGDQLYYHLVDGEGDNGSFFMLGGSSLVTTEEVFPYDFKTSYAVVVEAYDIYGGKLRKTITLGKGTASSVNFPTNVTLSNNDVPENVGDTVVGILTSVGATGYTFSLPSGSGDNSFFTLSGDTLKTGLNGLDFEAKSLLDIHVVSSKAGVQLRKTFPINVIDKNDAPNNIFLSNNRVGVSQVVNTFIGILAASDPDGSDSELSDFTFVLTSGDGAADNSDFSITGGNRLVNRKVFEVEEEGTKSVRVRVSDGDGEIFEKPFRITITPAPIDLNAPYTALSNRSLAENAENVQVASLRVENAEGAPYSFRLENNYRDNALFTITGTNILRNTRALDFESQPVLYIRLNAMTGSTTISRNFSIVVSNVNEAPTAIGFSNLFLNNQSSIGTVVSQIFVIDPDNNDSHSIRLTNEDLLGIDGDNNLVITGDVSVLSGRHNIALEVTDAAGLSFSQTSTLYVVSERGEEPLITLSDNVLSENVGDVQIGMISVENAGDATYTFSLEEGYGNNTLFSISNGNELRNTSAINFEENPLLSIRIMGRSGTTSLQRDFTILINDVNEAPTSLGFSSLHLNSRLKQGDVIGQIFVIDPDGNDSHTFQFSNTNLLIINNNDIQVAGDLARSRDLTGGEFEAEITVSDRGGLSYTQMVTFIVIDEAINVPEILLSRTDIDENSSTLVVGELSVANPGGNMFSFSLTEGYRDHANFMISNTSLQVVSSLNFEEKQAHFVQVMATAGSMTLTKAFVITVNDVNESPTAVTFSNLSLNNRSPQGTEISTLYVVDPDTEESYRFEVMDDALGVLSIANQRLLVDGDVSEISGEYEVTIRVTDKGNLSFDQEAKLVVISEETNAPRIDFPSRIERDEDATDTDLGRINVVNGGGNTYSYSLPVSFSDNSLFSVNAQNRLILEGTLDYERQSVYRVRIQATATGQDTLRKNVNIIVNDVNERPTSLGFSNLSVLNNVRVGTVVGKITVIDPDRTRNHIVQILDQRSEFSIMNNNIVVDRSLSSRVGEQMLNIQVTDIGTPQRIYRSRVTLFVDEIVGPSIVVNDRQMINEESVLGDKVATLSVENSTENWTFSVNNAAFRIRNNMLELSQSLTDPFYELEISASFGRQNLTKDIVVVADPVNDAPTDIGLDNIIIDPTWESGRLVSSLFMEDEDGDAPTFTLTAGTEYFEVMGDSLKLTTQSESSSTYDITLRGSDGQEQTERSFRLYTISSVTGILEDRSPMVYPNPVTNQLYVSKSGIVTIYDLKGVLLKREEVEHSIDVSDLSEGLYLIKLETKRNTFKYRVRIY